jgi:hypothetical protein
MQKTGYRPPQDMTTPGQQAREAGAIYQLLFLILIDARMALHQEYPFASLTQSALSPPPPLNQSAIDIRDGQARSCPTFARK